MTPQNPIPASPEALFRFQVVSTVLAAIARGESQPEAVTMMASLSHPTLSGAFQTVSVRSLYRWLSAYRSKGMAGLEPTKRERCNASVVLSMDFLHFLTDQKGKDPRASVPELILRARQLGIVAPDVVIDRVTVWRAAHRLALETKRRKHPKQRDVRRFAYANRMQMVLADGKHFRAGPERAKRVALFFLDDASRYGLHAVVGTSENKMLFLRGLYEMSRKNGFADVVFLDHGPGFIFKTAEVVSGKECVSNVAALKFSWPNQAGFFSRIQYGN
jgi:transposase